MSTLLTNTRSLFALQNVPTFRMTDITEHRLNLSLHFPHCRGLLLIAIQRRLAYKEDLDGLATFKAVYPDIKGYEYNISMAKVDFVQAPSICTIRLMHLVTSQRKSSLATRHGPLGYLKASEICLHFILQKRGGFLLVMKLKR